MRFFILVAATAGIGAGSVVAMQTVFSEQSAAMVAGVRAFSAEATKFRVSDFNPIRAIYDDVKSEITSPNPGAGYSFKISSPPLPTTFSGPIKLPDPVRIDQRAIDRAIAAGINAQVQQNYVRSQA